MLYIPAGEEHAEQVTQLVQDTVRAVYPKYYPKEVVEFFSAHHSGEKIRADIKNGKVWILFCGGHLAGTGCVEADHITRVYVLPAFQGNGYGSYIMRRLEDEIAKTHAEAVVDASLPASRFYEKRGYKTVKHEILPVENGAVLVYEIMKKDLSRGGDDNSAGQ